MYYEIKDKVVEEKTEFGRIVRLNRKTKVFGCHITHETRNLLMELLRERVVLHPDKFISPTIHKELTGLEVKRNGRIEHSDLTHDDQIFSLLMCLYVWYEGKQLRENWGIEKTSIKTESGVDEVIDMSTGPNAQADISKYIERANTPVDEVSRQRMEQDLAQVQQAKGKMFGEFAKEVQHKADVHLSMMLRDPRIREAYARYYGVHPDSVDPTSGRSSYDDIEGTLPVSLFTDFNKDSEEMDDDSIYRTMITNMGMYGSDQYNNTNVYEDESQM